MLPLNLFIYLFIYALGGADDGSGRGVAFRHLKN